jgi:hypothetical protein
MVAVAAVILLIAEADKTGIILTSSFLQPNVRISENTIDSNVQFKILFFFFISF